MEQNRNFLSQYKKNKSCNTFIIAEAGVHHGCDLRKAKELINAAADAGADTIKFQTYKADTLVTHWAPTYWKQNNGRKYKTQADCFQKRDKFNFEDYQVLNEYAKKKEINFCSTPFDHQSVRWLNDLDIPFMKVASGDLDNYPLLEEIAQTQKPIILSTGASYFKEVNNAVDFLRSKGVKELALMHCTLSYPTPNGEANLYRIAELKKLFPEITIGYSDHTVPDEDIIIPAIAVALGARIVEKHFTLDRTLPEDDHYHSADTTLLRRMIKHIKLAEEVTAITAEIVDSEMPARKNARRSLVANEVIPEGTVITKDMLIPKRPGGGISPSLFHKTLGRKLRTTMQRDQQILWDYLE